MKTHKFIKIGLSITLSISLVTMILCSLPIASAANLGGHRVWNDLNSNGIQDLGEPGMSGVTVELHYANGILVESTVTNTEGYYGFWNVPAGSYYEKVIAPEGYDFTLKDQGSNEELDSDVDQITGQTDVVTVSSEETYCYWDAGLVATPDGDEGLTPGFWKTHTELWGDKYAPSDSFNAIFGVTITIDKESNPTLLDALKAKGGVVPVKGVYDALARHAVAALLNADNEYVDYPLTEAAIISLVQNAINGGDAVGAKDTLQGYNQLGGGIDAHGNPI